MKILNDEYTLDIEALVEKDQIENIRQLIIDADTPFSIGISGRWGSGKTSIMKYLMASLGGEPIKHRLNFQYKALEEKEEFENIFKKFETTKRKRNTLSKKIHTIWFNPWENEKHQEPMVGLLQAIRHHFSFVASSIQEGKKIANVTIKAGIDLLGDLIKLGSGAGSSVEKIGEKYEKDNFQYIDRNQKFKFIFEEAIEILLQKGMETIEEDARVVIFIDDLDRCEDETIARLLKEIKQYLTTKRCVFVFGYDRHHIEKSLSHVETKTAKETRAYLEKLFQATFYIKEPSEDKLKTFIGEMIAEYNFVGTANQEDFSEYLSGIIDPNPRRIKNYLTMLYFHIKSSTEFGSSTSIGFDDFKRLALVAYLKLFYESVYSVLENKPELLKDLLAVFKNRKITDITNQREYFFQLEMTSHLHDINIDNYSKHLEATKEYEEKFLNEVYQMQGKHKSFENYMKEFVDNFDESHDIKKYL